MLFSAQALLSHGDEALKRYVMPETQRECRHLLSKRKWAVCLSGSSVLVYRKHQIPMLQVVQPHILTTLQADNLTSLKSQITDFCAQWRTLSEIAEHVQRSRQYLRGEVIPQMLDVLERKYDSPTHPKQQYRVKK